MSRDGVRSELAFLQSKLNEIRDKVDFAPTKILALEIGELADTATSISFDVAKFGIEPQNGGAQ